MQIPGDRRGRPAVNVVGCRVKQKVPVPRRNGGEQALPNRDVEMGRIELPSDVVSSGLLRVQFAAVFLGPSYLANK